MELGNMMVRPNMRLRDGYRIKIEVLNWEEDSDSPQMRSSGEFQGVHISGVKGYSKRLQER